MFHVHQDALICTIQFFVVTKTTHNQTQKTCYLSDPGALQTSNRFSAPSSMASSQSHTSIKTQICEKIAFNLIRYFTRSCVGSWDRVVHLLCIERCAKALASRSRRVRHITGGLAGGGGGASATSVAGRAHAHDWKCTNAVDNIIPM